MRPPRPSSCSKPSSSYSLSAASLKIRLLTVFKKAQELTTLCDIEACVIHYGPDGELKTWPENRDKVRDLALRYIQLDKAKRLKKSVDLYGFLNKNKKKKTMTNNFEKDVEELQYPISDLYSPDQINELVQSLELCYSNMQERHRFLEEKANMEDRQQYLNPSHVTDYSQEESCVYDLNNNNDNFQHLCVSDHSALQESVSHHQLMPYEQNMMCMVNNFQDPCASSNTHDYSMFPPELQEPVSSNYGLDQLMQLYYGFDQNMCMGDTTSICNVPDPCLPNIVLDDLCYDFQNPYSGFMVGNPSFFQYFPYMSSSYVYENRLLEESTLPYL